MSDRKRSKYDISPSEYRKLKRKAKMSGKTIAQANREDMHSWSWTQYIVPVICGIMFIFVVCFFTKIMGI